jgi:hypothetical protein
MLDAINNTGEIDEPILGPVDAICELLFGLFMALTFVGAISVVNPGNGQVRELFVTAFGCNIAWGLVDAVIFLVRTLVDRSRMLTLVRAVHDAPDAKAAHRVIEDNVSRTARALLTPAEIEAVRGRVVAMPIPGRPGFVARDFASALAILLIVVASTVPVVLPFLVFHDLVLAKRVSHSIAVVMLFLGGLALGRYAGYGTWRVGLMMAALGTVMVAAINALGG